MARWQKVMATARDAVDRLHPAGLLYSTYEARLVSELDKQALPRHVAVMADGNRRWAKLNAPGEPLVTGYRVGAAKLQEFAHWCDEIGIEMITLWVLSTDNFTSRPASEVEPLINVICDLAAALASMNKWRVQTVGDLSLLPSKAVERLRAAEAATVDNQGMHINIAVSYGGRHELRDAFRSLLSEEARKGTSLEELSQTLEIEDIASHLYTAGQPDPDLVIRTSGEQRLSGFLIWQSAHSEFFFADTLWPDFRRVDFLRALRSFTQRERRFGG